MWRLEPRIGDQVKVISRELSCNNKGPYPLEWPQKWQQESKINLCPQQASSPDNILPIAPHSNNAPQGQQVREHGMPIPPPSQVFGLRVRIGVQYIVALHAPVGLFEHQRRESASSARTSKTLEASTFLLTVPSTSSSFSCIARSSKGETLICRYQLRECWDFAFLSCTWTSPYHTQSPR